MSLEPSENGMQRVGGLEVLGTELPSEDGPGWRSQSLFQGPPLSEPSQKTHGKGAQGGGSQRSAPGAQSRVDNEFGRRSTRPKAPMRLGELGCPLCLHTPNPVLSSDAGLTCVYGLTLIQSVDSSF